MVAACLLARAGWEVTVLERAAVAGGAVRTESLTIPGYLHDPYSAFYPLLHASPVLQELGLDRRVRWARFEASAAAVIEPGLGAVVHGDLERTVAELSRFAVADGRVWADLYRWWRRVGRRFLDAMLAPVGSVGPSLRFVGAAGIRGALETMTALLEPVEVLTRRLFVSEPGRALFASGASHTDLAIDVAGGVAQTLLLAMLAQEVNMPVPVGGAGEISKALVEALGEAGGKLRTGQEVARVVVERGRVVAVETATGLALRIRRAVVADVGPSHLVRLVGPACFPASYLRGVRRFRYGTGMFRVDLALDGPVAWATDGLARCGVVHVTGDLETMARSGYEVRRGLLPTHPLLIVGQHTVADPSRAPAGCHTLWIEMQAPSVPRGDAVSQGSPGSWSEAREPFAERVLDLLEGHAPGLRGQVVGTAVRTPADLEEQNPNLVGGDVGGGSVAIDQQLVFRPVPGWCRYATPLGRLYLCSASTHPGGGVHGAAGRNCAHRVLRDARLVGKLVRGVRGYNRRPST